MSLNDNDFFHGHKWVRGPKDITDDSIQYAVVEFGSIWIPGDERSRTNPGHGYGARTEQKIDLILFENKAAWEEEIRKRTEDHDRHYEWLPITFHKAKVTTTVNVKVEDLL